MFLHVCVHGGVARHPPRQTPLVNTPPGQTSPRPVTATTADGTHPTGMHSCFTYLIEWFNETAINMCLHSRNFTYKGNRPFSQIKPWFYFVCNHTQYTHTFFNFRFLHFRFRLLLHARGRLLLVRRHVRRRHCALFERRQIAGVNRANRYVRQPRYKQPNQKKLNGPLTLFERDIAESRLQRVQRCIKPSL